jgi:hypothetical protein
MANIPISLILFALMMKAVRATRRNIPEDAILHSNCRENLKSYIIKCRVWGRIMYNTQLKLKSQVSGMSTETYNGNGKQCPFLFVDLFTGLVEAPVCVYCDSVLYLDDRLVLPGTEEEEKEEQTEQSQETDRKSPVSPSS